MFGSDVYRTSPAISTAFFFLRVNEYMPGLFGCVHTLVFDNKTMAKGMKSVEFPRCDAQC